MNSMANVNHAGEKNPLVPEGWGVWAEINYLDSPTEYREYLPTATVQKSSKARDFMLLTASEHRSKRQRWIFPLFTCLVIVLIVGYSVDALMGVF